MVSSSPPSRGARLATFPTAVTIPVNIRAIQHEQGVLPERPPVGHAPARRVVEGRRR